MVSSGSREKALDILQDTQDWEDWQYFIREM